MLAKFIDKYSIELFSDSKPSIEFIDEGRVKIMVNPSLYDLKTIPSYSKISGDYKVYKELVVTNNVIYDIETQRKITYYTETEDKIYEEYYLTDK